MWRIPGALSRALNRFHAAHIQGCVHGEAEALGPSSLIPLGQNGKSHTLHAYGPQDHQKGQDQKKKGTYRTARHLPQCNFMDAFGWGAIAVFFVHLVRQTSFQNSSTGSSADDEGSRKSYLKQILLSVAQSQVPCVRRNILPNEVEVPIWNGTQRHNDSVIEDDVSSEDPSRGLDLDYDIVHLDTGQDGSKININSTSILSTASDVPESKTQPIQQVAEPEQDVGETVEFAASRLRDITETSFPVVLNIFGIISARDSADYRTAFHLFKESAENGYSKAQYNAGVCYEQGKGVKKNMSKAAKYYLLASNNGHNRAKYRLARYLLHDETKPEGLQNALRLLKEAAQSGLKEAQAYLGVLYSKEPHQDLDKAVRYLWMAAENGDVQSRYYLGVCYEKGFGVPVSKREAMLHYERASKTGHGPAQQQLLELSREQTEEMSPTSSSLRTVASSPCLPVLGSLSILTRDCNRYSANRMSNLILPHSLSTGNLLAISPVDVNNYSLASVTVPLPVASLRAIGVG
uniref:Death ligand signal enhancer n=1 Tax=Leptobrachium leishanense TaxID=445787 RepID=A0A8C5PVF1_9ANUR